MSQPAVFKLHDIAFERDDRLLLSTVNTELNGGDILQVEGPNGAGKTTLLRIIATALSPTDGILSWQGIDIRRQRSEYLQSLLFLGHLPGLKQSLSPLENLQWWRRVHTDQNPLGDEEVLAQIGLRGYEDVPCYSLSAGQQRRAALARLLVTEALLWVLDEPFTAIDKQGVAELQSLLVNHAGRGGMVILSTHQDVGIPGMRRLSLAGSGRVS